MQYIKLGQVKGIFRLVEQKHSIVGGSSVFQPEPPPLPLTTKLYEFSVRVAKPWSLLNRIPVIKDSGSITTIFTITSNRRTSHTSPPCTDPSTIWQPYNPWFSNSFSLTWHKSKLQL